MECQTPQTQHLWPGGSQQSTIALGAGVGQKSRPMRSPSSPFPQGMSACDPMQSMNSKHATSRWPRAIGCAISDPPPDVKQLRSSKRGCPVPAASAQVRTRVGLSGAVVWHMDGMACRIHSHVPIVSRVRVRVAVRRACPAVSVDNGLRRPETRRLPFFDTARDHSSLLHQPLVTLSRSHRFVISDHDVPSPRLTSPGPHPRPTRPSECS